MHIILHKIEVLVDWLIPPALAVLIIIIVAELFFTAQFDSHRNYADIFDGFVAVLFAVDLGFKYSRIRKMPKFVRKYWLEIIATIPVFLVFRVLELFRVPEFVETGQRLVHEIPVAEGVEKEAVVLGKEIGQADELGRAAKMIKTFKVFGRLPRFVKALHFFEKPTGQHHPHEKHKPGRQQHF